MAVRGGTETVKRA